LAHLSFWTSPKVVRSTDRKPTNMLYGAGGILRGLLRKANTNLVAVIFDADRKSHRKDLYPAYKGKRPPLKPDLAVQMPHLPELVEAFGIPAISIPGIEADDIIATYARLWDGPVVIISRDKDLMALVDDRVTQYDAWHKNGHGVKGKRYDAAGVIAKWGVRPDQIPDLLAIMGDSADNIPGVPGIGEANGKRLIAQWGSLEHLLDNIDQVTPDKIRLSLDTNYDKALFWKKLVTLDDGIQVPVRPYDLVVQRDESRERAFCREWEFTSLEVHEMEGLR
jgi:DNA polymerase I